MKNNENWDPLKYISALTEKPMDEVVNWFLLLIIFVFDPLAIAMIVAMNFAFSRGGRSNPPNISSSPYNIPPVNKGGITPPLAVTTEPPTTELKKRVKEHQAQLQERKNRFFNTFSFK